MPNRIYSVPAGVATAVSPILMTEDDTESEGRTLVHQLASGGVAVVMRPAGPRVGSLAMLFDNESDAKRAYAAIRAVGATRLDNEDRPDSSLTFVLPDGGRCRLSLDRETQKYWVVSTDFLEI
ncbi:hypothetical protein [Mycetocola saprophilus]|uniref:hypothetical protein n=1 Tax=Mycetocola saprophilus TaxID=76636 RepID=UPI003BF05451